MKGGPANASKYAEQYTNVVGSAGTIPSSFQCNSDPVIASISYLICYIARGFVSKFFNRVYFSFEIEEEDRDIENT